MGKWFKVFVIEVVLTSIVLAYLVNTYPDAIRPYIPWFALAIMAHTTWNVLQIRSIRKGVCRWGARKNKYMTWLIVFISGGVVFAVYWLGITRTLSRLQKSQSAQAHSAQPPIAPIAELRSHLVVEFVVDKVKNKHVDGHFLLKNEGPQEITVSNFIDETRNRVASEGSMEPVRNIISGGYLIRPTGFSIPEDGVGRIASRATYTSNNGPPFTVTYKFDVREIDLMDGRVIEAISRDEVAGTAEPISQIVRENFTKPVGTVMFWFQEKLPDGSSSTSLISAGDDRQINFDSNTRLVHLKMVINGKTTEIARPLLEPKQGLHFVAATWDAAGDVHLYVDGSQ